METWLNGKLSGANCDGQGAVAEEGSELTDAKQFVTKCLFVQTT